MTHSHRALAVIGALVLAAAPAQARAQQQPTPAVTASPEPGASVAPSPAPLTEATLAPTPESTAEPTDDATAAPKAPSRLVGTLMSVKGTIATVKMANGALQTYTVSAKTAALLKKSLGKKLAFRVLRGALDVLPH